tara:strand:+ start:837 stop:1079 length:243 start_codon:yes stop_codon:yes gene_type:complete
VQETIKEIVEQFFKDTKLDKIKEIEQVLIKLVGKKFTKKNIEQIYLEKEKVIIKTKTIEAKTELNLYKKTINEKIETIIK